jgi:hypothetical protein
MLVQSEPTMTQAQVYKNHTEEEDDNAIKCFIGNLPFGIKEDEIKAFFVDAHCTGLYVLNLYLLI